MALEMRYSPAQIRVGRQVRFRAWSCEDPGAQAVWSPPACGGAHGCGLCRRGIYGRKFRTMLWRAR